MKGQRKEIRRLPIKRKQAPFSAGDVSLLLDVKQASVDSSKGISGRENQQSCKELSVVPPPVIIANHDDNNDTRSETRTADEFESTNLRHSRDGDLNIKNNNNNIKRREERGSLSLITPNGSVDEVSLRLPLGIGLDNSPCGKRAALSSELDENDLQDDQSFQAKKKKRLSLSDEDVKKIDPRSENVTQDIESVTQDSALKDSEFNERNEGANNVEWDEANASGNDECDLLIRKEFGLGDEDSVTVFSSMGAAQGISVEHNKEVPLNSTIEDNVQAQENNRKANEGIGKGNSAQSYDKRQISKIIIVISMPFNLRILPLLEWVSSCLSSESFFIMLDTISSM